MKKGRELNVLAAEIIRQAKAKKDFIAPAKLLSLFLKPHGVELLVPDNGCFSVTPHCHGQIGDRLRIPAVYYNRCLADAGPLLVQNVNHWLSISDERRLVRTLDGAARAFLSDRYRPLDNDELAQAVLPVLTRDGVRIEAAELTDTRFYCKAVVPGISREIRKGDLVHAGVCVSNSEIGAGSLRVEPLVYRAGSGTGVIIQDSTLKKYHLGKGAANDSAVWELFKDETRKISDAALFRQVQDVTEAALSDVVLAKLADSFREAADERIVTQVQEVVEIVGKKFNFTDTQKGGILQALAKGGDLSTWGLAQAVTAHADTEESFDVSTQLQRVAGEIVELGARALKLDVA